MVDYTIPAVRLPDGTYVMESRSIAEALETLYPEPKAHLDLALLEDVSKTLKWVVIRLAPVLVPRMPRECLSGSTIEYHIEARKATFGMTLDELETMHGGEDAWIKATPSLRKLASFFKDDINGPFCLGDVPSYADFLVVGFLEWCRCLRGDILGA